MLNNEEYLELIYTGHERRDIDYKRDMPWDKVTKFGIIKDVLSFANYGGGYIVLGVAERDDGLGFHHTGVSADNQNSWEVTAVAQAVNEYAEPPVDVDVVPITDKDDNLFVLLVIPSHGTTPHVCKKDLHDASGRTHLLRKCAIYHRSKNKSCEEISSAEDFRALILRCILNERTELLRVFEQVLTGVSKVATEIPRRFTDPLRIMNGFSSEAQKHELASLEGSEPNEQPPR